MLLQVPRDRKIIENIKRLVEAAIHRYNKYRAPESIAKLEKIDGNVVRVRFEGSFCETCGINDWVDDFRYVLEDLGAEADLVSIIEPEDYYVEDWRIGVYRIKKLPENIDEIIRNEIEGEDQ